MTVGPFIGCSCPKPARKSKKQDKVQAENPLGRGSLPNAESQPIKRRSTAMQ
jgi:hypothetical protein